MDSSSSRPRGGARPPPRRPENSHALPKGTLPKKLQLFFAPRMPVPHLAPVKTKTPALPYTGIAQYVCHFEDPEEKDAEEGAAASPAERKFRNPEFAAQCRIAVETKAEKKLRLRKMRMERNAAKIKAVMQEWDPTKDEKIQGDPFKTLFLARASYQVTERELKRIFGDYGPIRNIRIVRDSNTGKSRGYAFIEYEHTADMKEAYKHADGMKIEGRRVVVDVERGRTMEGWRPARLGGGLGATSRKPKKAHPVRAEKPTSSVADRGARDDRPRRQEMPRDDRRGRDYGPPGRGGELGRRGGGGDPRSRGDYKDHRGGPPRDVDYRERERDYGMGGGGGGGGRHRERERRNEGSGRYDRERSSRYDKRIRDIPFDDQEDRPGKKKRELEEGELDNREVKETRRRERDMM